MTQPPFFSVIIPTYNRANFIQKTVESVLQQTFQDFEIIIIDDGSTDNTAQIVASIQDPKIMYHPKKNEERAVARNTGTALANGKYVNFLDSDDLLYPNHLEKAFEMVSQYTQPDWFHLNFEIKDEKGKLIRKNQNFKGDLNTKLIHGNFLGTNGVFIRRDIALLHPFNPDRALSVSEDYELWMRLASRYPIRYDNAITSVLIQHDSRSVMHVQKEKLEKRLELLYQYLCADEAFCAKFGKYKRLLRADLYTYLALHLAMSKQHRGDVLKYLIKAFWIYPQVLTTKRFYATLKNFV